MTGWTILPLEADDVEEFVACQCVNLTGNYLVQPPFAD
jgi:hypothetical protein